MYDIYVHCINMDTGVKEQVFQNVDSSYSVFINSKLTFESQMLAYKHALRHICNGDFNQSDVNAIEQKAHAV